MVIIDFIDCNGDIKNDYVHKSILNILGTYILEIEFYLYCNTFGFIELS